MNDISAHNATMVKHIADVSGHAVLLKGQLQECELHWNQATVDNVRLHQKVSLLSGKLEVRRRTVAYIAKRPRHILPLLQQAAGSASCLSVRLINDLTSAACPV